MPSSVVDVGTDKLAGRTLAQWQVIFGSVKLLKGLLVPFTAGLPSCKIDFFTH